MPVDPTAWMARLEARHLATLQFSEVSRALRALSSAYVERRETALARHRVLDGAGKRAAFALYYGPLHFLATTSVLQLLASDLPPDRLRRPVIDLGCGTGAAGAAAALATAAPSVHGIDAHPWALDEARDTYATFGLAGTVARGIAGRLRVPRRPSLIVLSYVVNELPEAERAALRHTLLDAVGRGSGMLVIEPMARSAAPWWADWVEAFAPRGARADEWKLAVTPPPLVQRLGKAAGLTATQVNLRTLLA